LLAVQLTAVRIVVRLQIPELLRELRWTPYRLAKELGVTQPAVYRLVKRQGRFDRLSATLLDRLCVVTGKRPGELVEWTPDATRNKGRNRKRTRPHHQSPRVHG